jgi:hypothetical protein
MKEGKERSYFWGRNNMICSAKEREISGSMEV